MGGSPGNELHRRAISLNLQRRRELYSHRRVDGALPPSDILIIGPIGFFHAATESLFGVRLLPSRKPMQQGDPATLARIQAALVAVAPLIITHDEHPPCNTMCVSARDADARCHLCCSAATHPRCALCAVWRVACDMPTPVDCTTLPAPRV